MHEIFTFITNNKNCSILAFSPVELIEYKEAMEWRVVEEFLSKNQNEYRFGFISYDLTEDIVGISQTQEKRQDFPKFGFFVPQYVVEIRQKELVFLKGEKNEESWSFVTQFLQQQKEEVTPQKVQLFPSISKEKYIFNVKEIQQKIEAEEIEELTYCLNFEGEGIVQPFSLFHRLNEISKAPYSCFLKWKSDYLLSGSPECFIQRKGNKLISQPIKGTARRGNTPAEDERLKKVLKNSEKEQNENRLAANMVKQEFQSISGCENVEIEEFGRVYSFNTVHQLISTISGQLQPKTTFTDIIQSLFPMGSMTGVPKIKAVEILTELETFHRGLYAGTVGYFQPNGDFDFNVVIRSILYNEESQKISCPVGGAITKYSHPEEEYEECLVKLEGMKNALYGKA